MSENKEPLSLLYPDEKSRQELKKRRMSLSALPDSYINDMQAERLSRYLSPENFQFSLNIFKELCTDERTINYRLDALEDMLKLPKLSAEVHTAVNTILNNHRDNMSDISSPDSFAALSARIESLDVFIGAVEKICGYYEKEGKDASSEAFKSIFGYFNGMRDSKSYADLKTDTAELKAAFSKKIRCVTVAINFNEEMRPVSAGIVSTSDTPAAEKLSVFDRILYRHAKHADVNVKKLHTKYMGDTKDISETDKKLFEELERTASDYMNRLNSCLEDYMEIDIKELGMLEQQLSFLDKAAELVRLTEAKGLKMCRPKILPMKERKAVLKDVFDINLFRSAVAASPYKTGGELLVTNDISLDENGRFYLLCGANNGGKTTFVRAVGMCQLFAQSGLFVPAAECELSPADYIYTHFPKEEEVGINTSRFTEEIKDLKKIAESVTENSMLMMNESIQSTTPAECLDIAEEFVRIFTIIGARGIFATHLSELSRRLDSLNSDPDNHSRADCLVAGVNEETGERIYRISKGMPGKTSYASVIFDKFGISAEEIREKIRRSSPQ